MKVAITIQHPAHVHFFKHVVRRLNERGDEVAVYVRETGLASELLRGYGIPHVVLGTPGRSWGGLLAGQLRYEYRLLERLRDRRPDVVVAIGGLAASHAGAVARVPSVVFTDSEHRSNWLMAPFADAICTPLHFGMEFGGKHRRYAGFQELAYLHPARFEPDPGILRGHGVDPEEPYSVVRFSDMRAGHDVGQAGFSAEGKRTLLRTLEGFGTPFVAAEGTPSGGQGVPVPPRHFHHLLAYADLVVSDSSTTATEAALLGAPAVRSNTFAGADDMRNFVELGERYGLVHSTPDEREAIDRCAELLADPSARERWSHRRQALLADAIDVVPFVLDVLVDVGRSSAGPTPSEAIEA